MLLLYAPTFYDHIQWSLLELATWSTLLDIVHLSQSQPITIHRSIRSLFTFLLLSICKRKATMRIFHSLNHNAIVQHSFSAKLHKMCRYLQAIASKVVGPQKCLPSLNAEKAIMYDANAHLSNGSPRCFILAVHKTGGTALKERTTHR